MPEDNMGSGQVTKGVRIDQLVPHLNRDGWKTVRLSDDQWQSLELALGRPLDSSLREATCEAISYFIHSLRLKDQISTPRQYSQELRVRIAEIIETANNLLSEITPLGGKPTEINKISVKAAQRLVGGRDATWNTAADAARTTEDGDEVWAVEDHVRHLIAASFPDEFSKTHAALLDLLRALHAIQNGIASISHNKAGADGHYELNMLLVGLLRVAEAAGDDLHLASHDIRDKVMRKTVKPNPAYRFVERVVELIVESADALVADLPLTDDDQAKLLGHIKNNLDRKPGTLIDPLEAARTIIKDGRRE